MTINVLNVTPAAGEITRSTPLQFDIRTSEQLPFVRVFVALHFPGSEVVELAYAQNPIQGGPFERFYSIDSTVAPVSAQGFTQYRFTLLRQADGVAVWPDSPLLRVYACNSAGEEITPIVPEIPQ